MARNAGKIIDHIEYRTGASLIRVPLRLLKDARDGTYEYVVHHTDPEINVSGADINAVRKQVLQILREKLSIDWKPVIMVTTGMGFMEHRGSSSARVRRLTSLDGSRELVFNIAGYYVGTDVAGQPVYKYRDLDGTQGIESIWKGVPRGDEGEVVAILPDTPEHRAQLQAVVDAFTELAARISSLMGQDQIVSTLAHVNRLGLPKPKESTKS